MPHVIGFYAPDGRYGCLSNWYPSVFRLAGVRYTSAEQFMMAQKARLFPGNEDIYRAILAASDPGEIKALGRAVENFDGALWDRVRGPMMRLGLREKFRQNAPLLNVLLGTGDAILAECSPGDLIWGIGLDARDARVQTPALWPGKNLLGRTLAQARGDLDRWMSRARGNIRFEDARDAAPIDPWNRPLARVMQHPAFAPATAVYRDIVCLSCGADAWQKAEAGSLADLETSLRTDPNSPFPAVWFWEMKQDIYDTFRLGDACAPAAGEKEAPMAYDLTRFHEAQAHNYEDALAEMRRGRKQSHWMWYIFPQHRALGRSHYAIFYGLEGVEEARAYWADPILRERLLAVCRALLAQPDRDPRRVMGKPDDKKLRSCMTLFAHAVPDCPVFGDVLAAFFGGEEDPLTLELLT